MSPILQAIIHRVRNIMPLDCSTCHKEELLKYSVIHAQVFSLYSHHTASLKYFNISIVAQMINLVIFLQANRANATELRLQTTIKCYIEFQNVLIC